MNNYNANNNGRQKPTPPLGRHGSEMARQSQGSKNINRMFNSNSAVQNIPSHEMNRFRQHQQQAQYYSPYGQPQQPPQHQAPNPETEHWRNQTMQLMQQIQQLQQSMQLQQPQQQPTASSAAALPAAPPTSVAPPPPRPPGPPAAAAAAAAPAAAPMANDQVQRTLTQLTNLYRDIETKVQHLLVRQDETENKVAELYKYLNDWNNALQNPEGVADYSAMDSSEDPSSVPAPSSELSDMETYV